MTLASDRPLVYLISDGSMTNENYHDLSERFLSIVRAAVDAKIPLIQIREKILSSRYLYELGKSVMDIARFSKTRVLINDRLDVVLATKADGVHLTSNSVPAEVVRQFVPNGFFIGVSAHSKDDIANAKQGHADFAVFGPVYSTPEKPKPIGLAEFRSVTSNYPGFPILGLGGIDETNYRDVLSGGAAGFAGIRFLNNVSNLQTLGRELDL